MVEGIGILMYWVYWIIKCKIWKSFREYIKRVVYDSGF